MEEKSVEDASGSVDGGKAEPPGEPAGLDTEMTQEQEQEQEVEQVEVALPVTDEPEYLEGEGQLYEQWNAENFLGNKKSAIKGCFSPLADLHLGPAVDRKPTTKCHHGRDKHECKDCSGSPAAASAKSADSKKTVPSKAVPQLTYPPGILFGDAYCPRKEKHKKLHKPRKLKNVFALGYQTGTMGTRVLILSLAETESLRRLVDSGQLQSDKFGLCTLDGLWITAEPSVSEACKQEWEGLRQCVRFFNTEMYFSQENVGQILDRLHGLSLSMGFRSKDDFAQKKQKHFDQLLMLRQRESREWRNTMVSKVLLMTDAAPIVELEAIREKIQLTFQQQFTEQMTSAISTQDFNRMLKDVINKWDEDKSDTLSRDELKNGLMQRLRDKMAIKDVDSVVNSFIGANNKAKTVRFSTVLSFFAKEMSRKEEQALQQKEGRVAIQKKLRELRQVHQDTGNNASSVVDGSGTDLTMDILLEGDGQADPPSSVPSHLVHSGVVSIGCLCVCDGSGVSISHHSVLETSAGHTPIIMPRGVLLTKSSTGPSTGITWYYEVSIERNSTGGMAALGWANSDFVPHHKQSYFESTRSGNPTLWALTIERSKQQFRSNGNSAASTAVVDGRADLLISPGDVIGCSLNVDAGEVHFLCNGISMTKTATFSGVSGGWGGLIPFIQISFGCKFHVNLGQSPFVALSTASPTKNLRSIHSWVKAKQQLVFAQLAGPKAGEMAVLSGMSGGTKLTKVEDPRREKWVLKKKKVSRALTAAGVEGLLLTSGRWYFEVKMLTSSSFMKIGLVDASFRWSCGLGCNKHSWSWQTYWGDALHNSTEKSLCPRPGRSLSVGDTFGVAVDVDTRTIWYFYNGKPLIKWDGDRELGYPAFEGIAFDVGLTPVVQLSNRFKGEIEINFGAKFDKLPSGFRPISQAISDLCREGPPGISKRFLSEIGRGAKVEARQQQQQQRQQHQLRAVSGRNYVHLSTTLDGRPTARSIGYLPSVTLSDTRLTSGKWYYEVEIVRVGGFGRSPAFQPGYSDAEYHREGGKASIGWAESCFFGDSTKSDSGQNVEMALLGQGVGDDRYSRGFAGCLPIEKENKKQTDDTDVEDDSEEDDDGNEKDSGLSKISADELLERLVEEENESVNMAAAYRYRCGSSAGGHLPMFLKLALQPGSIERGPKLPMEDFHRLVHGPRLLARAHAAAKAALEFGELDATFKEIDTLQHGSALVSPVRAGGRIGPGARVKVDAVEAVGSPILAEVKGNRYGVVERVLFKQPAGLQPTETVSTSPCSECLPSSQQFAAESASCRGQAALGVRLEGDSTNELFRIMPNYRLMREHEEPNLLAPRPRKKAATKPLSQGPESQGPESSTCWKAGDVICCALDIDQGTMHFSVNAPIDLTKPPAFDGFRTEGGFAPAASLHPNCEMAFNFSRTSNCPPGFNIFEQSSAQDPIQAASAASASAAVAAAVRVNARARSDDASAAKKPIRRTASSGTIHPVPDDMPHAVTVRLNEIKNEHKEAHEKTSSGFAARFNAMSLRDAHLSYILYELCDVAPVTELDISNNALGLPGLEELGKFLEHSTDLLKLNLSGNLVGPKGAAVLAHALSFNETLKELELDDCHIAGDSVGLIAGILTERHPLHTLSLRNNEITADGGVALSQMLYGAARTRIKKLDVAHNLLKERGMTAIASSLQNNTTLTHLDIDVNEIELGIRSLADMLKTNRTIKVLRIGAGNKITGEGLVQLGEAICENSALPLTTLYISDMGASITERLRLSWTLAKQRKPPLDELNMEPLLKITKPRAWVEWAQRPLCFSICNSPPFTSVAKHLIDLYNKNSPHEIESDPCMPFFIAEQIIADAGDALRHVIHAISPGVSVHEGAHGQKKVGSEGTHNRQLKGLLKLMVGGEPGEKCGVRVETRTVRCKELDYEREGRDSMEGNKDVQGEHDASVEIAIDAWYCSEPLRTGLPTRQRLGQGRPLTALLLALHHNDDVTAKILLGHNATYTCNINSGDSRRDCAILQDSHSGRLYRQHVDHLGIAVRDVNKQREEEREEPYRHRHQMILKHVRPSAGTEMAKEYTSVLRGGCSAIRIAGRESMDGVVELLLQAGKNETDWSWLGSRDEQGRLIVNEKGQHAVHELCQAAPEYITHNDVCNHRPQTHLLQYMRLLIGDESTDDKISTFCKYFVYPHALSELDKTLVWVEDSFRRLPLHYAAAKGNQAMVRVLLVSMEGGTEQAATENEVVLGLSALDNAGWAPLSLAVYHCHLECVRMLLKAGACPLNSHLPQSREDLRNVFKKQHVRYQEFCMETYLPAVSRAHNPSGGDDLPKTPSVGNGGPGHRNTMKAKTISRLKSSMGSSRKYLMKYRTVDDRPSESQDPQTWDCTDDYWQRWKLPKQECESQAEATIPSPCILALVRKAANDQHPSQKQKTPKPSCRCRRRQNQIDLVKQDAKQDLVKNSAGPSSWNQTIKLLTRTLIRRCKRKPRVVLTDEELHTVARPRQLEKSPSGQQSASSPVSDSACNKEAAERTEQAANEPTHHEGSHHDELYSSMQRAKEEQANATIERVLSAMSHSPLVVAFRTSFVLRYLLTSVGAYLIYVGIITTVAFWNSYDGSPDIAWRVVSRMQEQIHVSQVGSSDDLDEFLTGPLAEFLYGDSIVSINSSTARFDVGHTHSLIGSVRFRQLRASERTCSNAPSIFGNYLAALSGSAVCSSQDGSFDTSAFTSDDGSVHTLTVDVDWAENGEWFRESTAEAPWKIFPKSGFVLDIAPNLSRDSAVVELSRIVEGGWTDPHTRALFVDFSLYSWDVDTLTAVHLAFEYPRGGGVVPSSMIVPIHWPKWQDWAQSLSSLSLEICLYAGTVVNLLIEVNQMWSSRSVVLYLKLDNNLADVSVLILLLTYASFRVLWWARLPDRQTTLSAESTGYLDLESLVWCHACSVDVIAFGVIIAWFKLIFFMIFIPTMGPMIQASASSITSLVVNVYLGFFLLCVFVAALGLHIAFGYRDESFTTMSRSFLGTFEAFLEGADTEHMQESSYWLGTVVAVSITVFGTLTLTNIFIAVVSKAYEANLTGAEAKWDREIDRLLVMNLQNCASNMELIKKWESGGRGCLQPLLRVGAWCARKYRAVVFEPEVRYCHHPHKYTRPTNSTFEDVAEDENEFRYLSTSPPALPVDVTKFAMTDLAAKQLQRAEYRETTWRETLVKRQDESDATLHRISEKQEAIEGRLAKLCDTLTEVARRTALV
jgi:ankyrin repeat protein